MVLVYFLVATFTRTGDIDPLRCVWVTMNRVMTKRRTRVSTPHAAQGVPYSQGAVTVMRLDDVWLPSTWEGLAPSLSPILVTSALLVSTVAAALRPHPTGQSGCTVTVELPVAEFDHAYPGSAAARVGAL